MKYIGENAIKKLISLIKGDLATKQPTITASGLLKGDGTTISQAVAGTDYVVPSTALNELPGHLDNASIHVTASDKENWNQKANLVISEIPKGRMRGDINGIGKVGTATDLQNSGFMNKALDPTNPDSWACDINADGGINTSDINVLYTYNYGNSSVLTQTPTFADFYNNWTYHKVDDLTGYWTTDLVIPNVTAEMDVSINVQGSVRKDTFIKAEPLAGGIRIHANYPPIRALPCSVTYREGTGQATVCAVEGIPDLEERKELEVKLDYVTLLASKWSQAKLQVVDVPDYIQDSSGNTPAVFTTFFENKAEETKYKNAGVSFERLPIFKKLRFYCETTPTEDIVLGVILVPVTANPETYG